MSAVLNAADRDIRSAVIDELAWTPELSPSARIEVRVADGAVTLTGRVDRLIERLAALRAISAVRGVRSVSDEIEVATSVWDLDEADVAQAVGNALHWASGVPASVKGRLHEGTVVLTGEVAGEHERRAAQEAVERVHGVERVDNRITLARRPSAADTRERIQNAIVRNAVLDSDAIQVEADGTRIILRGRVRTWLEKAQASTTAWASPHVTEVDNRIVVEAD